MSDGAGDVQGRGLAWPPFASTAAFVEVLAGRRQIGPADQGPHVKTLEEALVIAGFGLPGGAEPDVRFTRGTAGAILRLQKEKALPQTGALDRATLIALDGAIALKKGAKGGATRVDTIRLMNEILAESRLPGSDAGSRITRGELDRALSALQWDDGVVSPSEYAAAKASLESEGFQRAATADAKARALEFLSRHSAKAGRVDEAALEVLKLDAFHREGALGKGLIASESQMAIVKLSGSEPAGAERLPSIIRRAFGRQGAQGLEVAPFRSVDQVELARVLERKVGESTPGPDEVRMAAAHLAEHAKGGGDILVADWTEKAGGAVSAGTFYVAGREGGRELLVLDLLRVDG